MTFRRRAALALFAVLSLVAAACGSDEVTSSAEDATSTTDEVTSDAAADAPTVAVTTNILGDVVTNLVGDQMNVVTVMPVGADPHDFQASAQQVAQMGEAAALIVNGADFEEGLLDVIETVEGDGVPVYAAISTVSTIEFGEGGHDHDEHDEEHGDEEHGDEDHDDEHGDEAHDDEHGDEAHDDEHGDEAHDDEHGDEAHDDEHGDEEHDDEHGDEEHDDEHGDEEHDDEHGDEAHDDEHGDEEHDDEHDHGHDHSGEDPHFFTDPARMAVAADGIADFLIANVEGIDTDALRSNADAYIAELNELDTEVEGVLAELSDEQRVLVTNHEVFGYFADRFDFEVVGSVIPGGSTADGASAQALAELADVIEDEGVPAIFADTSSSDELAQTLADEVGDIEVVELFSESLGDADSEGATYLDMVRANANRIAAALAA